jgi:hypothetical protein
VAGELNGDRMARRRASLPQPLLDERGAYSIDDLYYYYAYYYYAISLSVSLAILAYVIPPPCLPIPPAGLQFPAAALSVASPRPLALGPPSAGYF